MLFKTRAIALHSVKYSDNSIITNLYTEKFGKQAFLVKGVYGKKSNFKSNLFSPLNLLELELYKKPLREIHQLKEAVNFPVYQSIHTDFVKNTLSIFIAETLLRIVQEESPNELLFDYLFNAFQFLDFEDTSRIANFHLILLIGISKQAGFYPINDISETKTIFDLLNGSFNKFVPEHGHYIDKKNSALFSKLINCNFENASQIQMDRGTRQILLDKLIEFYHLHIPGMGTIKSLQVFKDLYTD